MIPGLNMTPLTIGLIAFIAGGAITGGVIVKVSSSQEEQQDIDKVIESLETKFEKAQASAVKNLTQPDLLQVPCSAEYINGTFNDKGEQVIKGNGDLLCREMFCRMNRQGGGQNSGGGAGATQSDCSAISNAGISVLMAETCMPYWTENAGADQNSRYSRCIDIFDDGK